MMMLKKIAVALAFGVSANAMAADNVRLSVSEGHKLPAVFTFAVDDNRHQIDLREDHRYQTAFLDVKAKREICRDANYKTGLILTMRRLRSLNDINTYEVVGQITQVEKIETDDVGFSCGVNQKVELDNTAFAEIIELDSTRPKVVVIDSKWTILIKNN